jgi:hypothetical protein
MENILAQQASLSSDGKTVSFVAHVRGRDVQCSISRSTLEECFWVPAGANEARLLKACADGYKRIAATVERKMLKTPGEPIKLHATDFNH